MEVSFNKNGGNGNVYFATTLQVCKVLFKWYSIYIWALMLLFSNDATLCVSLPNTYAWKANRMFRVKQKEIIAQIIWDFLGNVFEKSLTCLLWYEHFMKFQFECNKIAIYNMAKVGLCPSGTWPLLNTWSLQRRL